jgi:hypothetical protein
MGVSGAEVAAMMISREKYAVSAHEQPCIHSSKLASHFPQSLREPPYYSGMCEVRRNDVWEKRSLLDSELRHLHCP